MTVRLPDTVAREFLRAWKRMRTRNALIWSPVILAIVAAVVAGFLIWRGHSLLYLLEKFVPQERVWIVLPLGIAGCAVLGTIAVCWAVIRDCRAVAVPYCTRCQNAQHSFAVTCEKCGLEISETRNYVYLAYDDEKKMASFFGLQGEEG